MIDRPLSAPTMESPRTPRRNSPGEVNAKIMGNMRGTDAASIRAPKTPPKAETVKAAPNARAACPFLAIG